MATGYYFWGTSKSGFAKREGKDGLLMHAPISTVFSIFFLPLFFFFLSLRSFYSQFLTTILPWVVFLPQVFSLLDPSLWVPPLGSYCSLTMGSSISSMAISPFYSKLIQWNFSLLPLGFHQLFLVYCGHSFMTTHQPIGCSNTISTQNTFAAPLLIS